jgi:hypothetical protein
MANKKGKGWPMIGTIRKGDKGSYIKLEDNVTILVDGEEIPLNKSRTCQLQSPVAKVERLIKSGAIKESETESRMEKAKEVNEWLKYEIVLPPPRD